MMRCQTVTLKGFNASNKEVDLLRLAGRIATADPVPLERLRNKTLLLSVGPSI